jgi:ribosome-binding protein aMBF1 (putative translation factor)
VDEEPRYRRQYEALEEEFSLAAALIEAWARAGLTQEQVAQRMKTTQAVVARLEGGGSMLDADAREVRQGNRHPAQNQL